MGKIFLKGNFNFSYYNMNNFILITAVQCFLSGGCLYPPKQSKQWCRCQAPRARCCRRCETVCYSWSSSSATHCSKFSGKCLQRKWICTSIRKWVSVWPVLCHAGVSDWVKQQMHLFVFVDHYGKSFQWRRSSTTPVWHESEFVPLIFTLLQEARKLLQAVSRQTSDLLVFQKWVSREIKVFYLKPRFFQLVLIHTLNVWIIHASDIFNYKSWFCSMYSEGNRLWHVSWSILCSQNV